MSEKLSIGEKLRQLRAERKMTINDITRLTDVSVGIVGDIERGKVANPGVYTLHKISRALRVNINYFLDDPAAPGNADALLSMGEYVQLLRNDNAREYLDATIKAFNAGVRPETLSLLIDAIISHSQKHED